MSFLDTVIAKTLPFVPKPIVKKVSSKYIAGETIADAVSVIKRLNSEGFTTTVDVLGEFITDMSQAVDNASEYIDLLNAIKHHKLDANISVKPTSMGLLINEEGTYDTIKLIAEAAAKNNIFMRIDMEDVECTQKEIDLLFNLREEYKNIGLVLQAYLKRTYEDIELMIKHEINLRLCKGIYVEDPIHIIPGSNEDREVINKPFLEHIKRMLETKTYVGIATHDEKVVDGALKLIEKTGASKEDYEFQFLLGVREDLRNKLRDAGHKVRIYVPYGKDWYGYSTRRLNENPKIAGYILKAMLFE
jgi:proline dehydrogenase